MLYIYYIYIYNVYTILHTWVSTMCVNVWGDNTSISVFASLRGKQIQTFNRTLYRHKRIFLEKNNVNIILYYRIQ